MARPHEDWTIIGNNVRFYREAQGFSQSDLASRAGVARRSVYALEHGHPARAGTFAKVCEALGMEAQEMVNSRHLPQIVGEERPFYVHRRSEEYWYADVDLGNERVDYLSAVQNPDERARLGRLGKVPSFSHALSFVMPDGPGVVFFEIYQRQTIKIPLNLYRTWMLLCLRGSVIVSLGGAEETLVEGDALGAADWTDFEAQPSKPTQNRELPPLLLAIGANRVGKGQKG